MPRKLLAAGAAIVVVAGAVLLYVVMQGGTTYEGVDNLRAALKENGYRCDLVGDAPARVRQEGSEATMCEIESDVGRYRLGPRVFTSEVAHSRFERNARASGLVFIVGDNWAIFTGVSEPLPEHNRFFERVAEDLGGEVVGGS